MSPFLSLSWNEQKKILRKLQFPLDLDMEFRTYYFEKSQIFLKFISTIGAAVYFLNVFTDWNSFPEIKTQALIIRSIASLIILSIYPFSFIHNYKKYHDIYGLFVYFVASFGLIFIMYLGEGHLSDLYHSGLILIMVAYLTFGRMKFRYATFGALIIVLSYLGIMIQKMGSLNSILLHNFSNLTGISILCILLVYIIEYSLRKEFLQMKLLENEVDMSNQLLLNILPEKIAKELKIHGSVKPVFFPSVTVLFADFVGFTKFADDTSADNLILELDEYFSKFDSIIKKYSLEKIKTIGDAYMACSGLPEENKDHAYNAIHAAKEMLQFADERNHKNQGKGLHKIRIGLHSGPLVAGVIGDTKFTYDVFGDTVNLANRMETASEPGSINISKGTFDLISNKFQCIERGKIAVKGKGLVEMYFVS
ncbi:MAG: adenylate/guanylate cyclase domain-containing protein [Leptospira sp.]|nr:adenylate/guanylate cyclase domain-containing protein [Leptospira sp.]NCS94219.1 adenylate/guanylate cyclase domain-containing protein [Leptospira sp.]